MISVCYLSLSRRRRARSRWCWAPAPGGCWMWLGRERKTTKTTVWCTAKVSKQRRHPVISPKRNTPCQSAALTILHPLHFCLSLFLSLFLVLPASQSHKPTNNCSHKDTHTKGTHASPTPYLSYSKESFISLKLWLETEKHHLTHKVNGL